MARGTKKKPAAKPAAKKFDVHAAAREILPKVFESMKEAALTGKATVAGQNARELLLKLGSEVEEDYVIDLKFIEIELNDEGTAARVLREVPRAELVEAAKPKGIPEGATPPK